MAHSRVLSFDDPDRFQAAFRAGNYELLRLPRGAFRAELTQVEFPRLAMQRSDRDGPAVVRSGTQPGRVAVMFLSDSQQPAPHRNGMELSAEELVVHRPGSINHLRSPASSRMAMMSLKPDDLAAASRAIVGCELLAPTTTSILRPAADVMARLRAIHGTACRLARTDDGTLSRPEIARSLEQQLVHAFVAALAGHDHRKRARDGGTRARLMRRFEDFLASRERDPVYLAEICAAIGASERTLRACCQEHLGMGPIRYLWRRRMTLAHGALLRADAGLQTVTDIATEHGFWELGRFSVEYRTLFGESPSASLRRPPQERPVTH